MTLTTVEPGQRAGSVRAGSVRGGFAPYVAVAVATLVFTVNFWAWGLISPLSTKYKALLHLNPFALSVLVAVPVIVGSLGRVPLGALTDRYGGRLMLVLVSLASMVPVTFLALVHSYSAMIAGGFVLGVAGASFAIGVPFVSSWFPPERRGMALGIFGAGNLGTAIANFVTPRAYSHWGKETTYLAVAGVLALTVVLTALLAHNSPAWSPSRGPLMAKSAAALQLTATKELAAVYAVSFGGFVAFGAYLPTFLKTVYHLGTTDAATRAAGFIVLATLARPVGGWLSDRVSSATVLSWALGVVAVGAVVAAFQPSIAVLTVSLLSVGAALGLSNGAVFALVGKRVDSSQVGAVTGVVGAVGGLGGFVPPLVMGAVYEIAHNYGIGLMLLSDVALAALVFVVFRLRATSAAAVARPADGPASAPGQASRNMPETFLRHV